MPAAVDLFYSYSHHDEELRDQLDVHLALLKRRGVLRTWHDRRIAAGTEWQNEIAAELDSADVILLLISADFLASDYCYDVEMKRALDRDHAHEACVIPVILRACDLDQAPFSHLQALPKNARPVTAWQDRDEAWLDVVRGIRRQVLAMPARESPATGGDDTRGKMPVESTAGRCGRGRATCTGLDPATRRARTAALARRRRAGDGRWRSAGQVRSDALGGGAAGPGHRDAGQPRGRARAAGPRPLQRAPACGLRGARRRRAIRAGLREHGRVPRWSRYASRSACCGWTTIPRATPTK